MDETDFLRGYDPNAFQRPSMAVDLVLLGVRNGKPAVLLLKRDQQPYQGRWALPGGFVGIDETLDAAAARVLRQKAGIGHAYLEQLYTFGAVDRDPRMRIISVAYLALLTETAFDAALQAMPALLPAAIQVPWSGEAGGPCKRCVAGKRGADARLRPCRYPGDRRCSGCAASSTIRMSASRSCPNCSRCASCRMCMRQFSARRSTSRPSAAAMLDKGWLAATGAHEAGTAYRPAELYRFQRP